MQRTWIRSGDRFVAVTVYRPETSRASGVVVLVPSAGFEAEVSYRTVQALAAHVARAGLLALLLDPTGYGDSPPLTAEMVPSRVWEDDVAAVLGLAAELLPDSPRTLIGYRLGGAIVTGPVGAEADRRIVWDAITGKQFLRRQRMLFRLSQPGTAAIAGEFLGLQLSSTQLDDIRRLEVATNAPGVTVFQDDDTEAAELAVAPDPYFGAVPLAAVRAITELCLRGDPIVLPSAWVPRQCASHPVDGGACVQEVFEYIGPDGLHGVLTRPQPDADPSTLDGTWVVFTAQGSERASGPANLWANEARRLAARGATCLRVERRGVGLHACPDGAREPHPFSREAILDVARAVDWARAHGGRNVVVVGSCAGAWLALAATREAPVDQVLAFSVPAWNAHPDGLGSEFLDHWHGVAPSTETATRADPKKSRRAQVERLIGFSPRLFRGVMASREVARAVHFRSFGLPILRAVPRRTAVRLVLTGHDLDYFTASGGRRWIRVLRWLGHDVNVHEVADVDHALRTANSDAVVQAEIAKITALPAPRRRRGAGWRHRRDG